MLKVGMRLADRYLIKKEVGQGGFGQVYQAFDTRFDNFVAIKQLSVQNLPEGTRTGANSSFDFEAKLLRKLSHPHLPKVIDYFAVGQIHFLVMDFIEGQNLVDYLEQQPEQWLNEAEALALMDPVLDALEYLHGQDPPIVHRDIKPGNIIRTPESKVYLVDFGLAKLDRGSRLNVPTAGFMSPGYAAPEQALRQVDPRADLYSVGATLYTLLTGEVPSSATDHSTSLTSRATEPLRPIKEVNASVSQHTAEVVMKLLALNPDDRYPTATAARQALRGERKLAVATTPAPVKSQTVKPRVSRGIPWKTVLIALIVVGAIWGMSIIWGGMRAGSITSPTLYAELPESGTSPVAQEGIPTQTSIPSAVEPISGGECTTHTVQPGETLKQISDTYSVSMEAIVSANPQLAQNPDYLQIGWYLCIPAVTQTTGNYLDQGNVFYASGQLEEAYVAYTQAIEQSPENVFAYNNRGFVSLDLGNLENAISDFDQAIAIDDTFASAYYGRGKAYASRNSSVWDRQQAIADLEQFLALGQDPDLRWQAEEQLRGLQSE